MAARNDSGSTEREEGSRRAAARMLTKLGLKVEMLDQLIAEPHDDMPDITEVRFRIRYATVGDVLALVKATEGDEKKIAFHVEDTFSQALVGLVNRMSNRSLKWREDKPYDER